MTSWTVLVDSPCMLNARVSPDGKRMTVYVSSIVSDDGDLYHPVADFLRGKDYTCTTEEIITDEWMMWGEAKIRTYELS